MWKKWKVISTQFSEHVSEIKKSFLWLYWKSHHLIWFYSWNVVSSSPNLTTFVTNFTLECFALIRHTHTEQLHVETKKYHIEQTWNFLRVQQHSGACQCAWNGFRLVLNAAPCLLCPLKHAGHRPSNRVKSVVQQGEHFMIPPLDILFYFA